MCRDNDGLTFREVSQEQLEDVAGKFLAASQGTKVWSFFGEMGSGKTTFIKKMCEQLGVEEGMSSPTFSIVNEYKTATGDRVYHFDFYRLKNEAEAYDIGAEEYFYSGNYCFIEWPEKIPTLLPNERAEVRITPDNQTLRTLALSVHDGKEKNRI